MLASDKQDIERIPVYLPFTIHKFTDSNLNPCLRYTTSDIFPAPSQTPSDATRALSTGKVANGVKAVC